MKIIFTVHSYYPNHDGVQYVTEYLAEGLSKRGHKVLVITGIRKGCPEKEVHHGVSIIRVNLRTRYGICTGDKKGYIKYMERITQGADILVSVCTQTALTDSLLPSLGRIRCKKILYMHGMHEFRWQKTDFEHLSYFLYKIWRNLKWGCLYRKNQENFRIYDEVIQLHELDAANIFFKEKLGITSKIMGNAAENIFFEKIQNEPEGNAFRLDMQKKTELICVSNYSERKNQEYLLRALRKCRNRNKCRLTLIGSEKNRYCRYLLHLREKNYSDLDVAILYGLSREESAAYILNADIFLLGSTWEAYPVSLIEAMASSVPFISTDVGCVSCLPGGVVVKNEDEMAYWTDLLIENRELRKKIGEAGREYSRSYAAIEKKVDQLENIMLELVNKDEGT